MMGTNYYLKLDICEHCRRESEQLHIGKSSAGWCFSLHVRRPGVMWDDVPAESLDDWRTLWSKPNTMIVDEYGDSIDPAEMERIITGRSWQPSREQDEHWYVQNQAEPGPFGLARSRIDGRHCIGHGEGTWDLISGEFS